ncbi:MAG: hypothetical protein LH468_08245 [Nocardioides sp.]|nr:hypothetical protein [Nocardioides sp.]
MNATRSRPWVVAGLLAALVLATLTWFLVIGPTRSETQTLGEDTAAVQFQNEALVAKTAQLREQAEGRDELETGVRSALDALPVDVSLPDFNRELATHAAAHGVEVSGISVGAAAAPGQATAAGAAPHGTIGVPITIQTRGPALSQLYFLRDVQEVGPRAVLVSATALTALENASVDDASTLTTQLTVFASALSGRDSELLTAVLRNDPTAG